jgi:hypothetical protein
MLIFIVAVVVAGAVAWAGTQIARELRLSREQAVRTRSLELMSLFAPGVAAVTADPRALVAWQPLAVAARKAFPEFFTPLDEAGSPFPFSPEQIQAAHARWTSEWLAWERAHDAEFKLKASAAEADLLASGNNALARARLDAVEREKLDLYQRHYEEYVRVAKALQALLS